VCVLWGPMKRLHDVAFSVVMSEHPWAKAHGEEKQGDTDIEDANMEDVCDRSLCRDTTTNANASRDEVATCTFHGDIKRRIASPSSNEDKGDLWRNHLIGAPRGSASIFTRSRSVGSSHGSLEDESKSSSEDKRGLPMELLRVLRFLLLGEDDDINIYHARELLMKYARSRYGSASLHPNSSVSAQSLCSGYGAVVHHHNAGRRMWEWGSTADAFSHLWQLCWEEAWLHDKVPSHKLCAALLNAGANVNTPVNVCGYGRGEDDYGVGHANSLCMRTTALHLCPNAELLELLLHARGDVTGGSSNGPHGYTPLHCAVKRGNAPMVKLLLRHNAPVNAWANRSSCVPMLGAGAGVCGGGGAAGGINIDSICSPRLNNMTITNDFGASRFPKNNNNITPLHISVQMEILPIIDILLNARADVTMRTSSGYTALHYAAAYGTSPDITRRLLASKNSGAAVHTRVVVSSGDTMTPLDMARKRLFQSYSRSCEAVVKLIEEAEDTTVSDDEVGTPSSSSCCMRVPIRCNGLPNGGLGEKRGVTHGMNGEREAKCARTREEEQQELQRQQQLQELQRQQQLQELQRQQCPQQLQDLQEQQQQLRYEQQFSGFKRPFGEICGWESAMKKLAIA